MKLAASGLAVKTLIATLGVLLVGLVAAILNTLEPSSALAAVQVAAGLLGGALAFGRAHHLWPMAVTFALALIVVGAHRLELSLSAEPAAEPARQSLAKY